MEHPTETPIAEQIITDGYLRPLYQRVEIWADRYGVPKEKIEKLVYSPEYGKLSLDLTDEMRGRAAGLVDFYVMQDEVDHHSQRKTSRDAVAEGYGGAGGAALGIERSAQARDIIHSLGEPYLMTEHDGQERSYAWASLNYGKYAQVDDDYLRYRHRGDDSRPGAQVASASQTIADNYVECMQQLQGKLRLKSVLPDELLAEIIECAMRESAQTALMPAIPRERKAHLDQLVKESKERSPKQRTASGIRDIHAPIHGPDKPNFADMIETQKTNRRLEKF